MFGRKERERDATNSGHNDIGSTISLLSPSEIVLYSLTHSFAGQMRSRFPANFADAYTFKDKTETRNMRKGGRKQVAT